MDEAVHERAVLGGGCFWCLEAIFSGLRGVHAVTPGYAGGHLTHPSYEAVCAGKSGHAEVVQILFDPQELSYADLLRIFYTTHDPTQLNRQDHDVGEQYRSVILVSDPAQEAIAHEVTQEMAETVYKSRSLTTMIDHLSEFWPAEQAHHRYFELNPKAAYCTLVVAPKVAKARRLYVDRLSA